MFRFVSKSVALSYHITGEHRRRMRAITGDGHSASKSWRETLRRSFWRISLERTELKSKMKTLDYWYATTEMQVSRMTKTQESLLNGRKESCCWISSGHRIHRWHGPQGCAPIRRQALRGDRDHLRAAGRISAGTYAMTSEQRVHARELGWPKSQSIEEFRRLIVGDERRWTVRSPTSVSGRRV